MAKCLIRILSDRRHKYRSVAVIEEHSSSVANLNNFFPDVPITVEDRYYLKSFEYWVGNFHINERFHGWNKSQNDGKYTECFVFKNVSEATRVYGFLCRPKPLQQDYLMCVLVHVAQKKKWKTDVSELERVRLFKDDADVLKALSDPELFEKGKGKAK